MTQLPVTYDCPPAPTPTHPCLPKHSPSIPDPLNTFSAPHPATPYPSMPLLAPSLQAIFSPSPPYLNWRPLPLSHPCAPPGTHLGCRRSNGSRRSWTSGCLCFLNSLTRMRLLGEERDKKFSKRKGHEEPIYTPFTISWRINLRLYCIYIGQLTTKALFLFSFFSFICTKFKAGREGCIARSYECWGGAYSPR